MLRAGDIPVGVGQRRDGWVDTSTLRRKALPSLSRRRHSTAAAQLSSTCSTCSQ